jgi:hypothetical protein
LRVVSGELAFLSVRDDGLPQRVFGRTLLGGYSNCISKNMYSERTNELQLYLSRNTALHNMSEQ